MKFLISTNDMYAKKTLPVIIPSLMNAGIEASSIVVCYNSNKKTVVIDTQKIEHRYYDTSLYEYVCFLVALEIDEDTFMLHDTCEVMPNFFDNLNQFIKNKKFNSIKLKKTDYSCNIGLYSSEYLNSIRNRILSFPKSIDKLTAVSWEDSLFSFDSLFFQDSEPVVTHDDVYGTNNIRRIEYFQSIGLKKYKSHWGQGIVGDRV